MILLGIKRFDKKLLYYYILGDQIVVPTLVLWKKNLDIFWILWICITKIIINLEIL